MFLKDHLKDTYQKASFDKNHSMVEDIINRWAHRFGIKTLNELIIKNQDQIKLIEEDRADANHRQINMELFENVHNEKQTDLKAKETKKSNQTKIINEYSYESFKNKSEYKESEELPLPKINNLRRWINNVKKAS